MPQPITPIHKLDAHEALFDVPNTMSGGYSALQAIVLDLPTKTAAIKYEPKVLELLEKINKNEDELITAASNAKTKLDEKFYRVPSEVTDNDVLSLKAAGLLTGGSKSVKITEKGMVALRSKWLNESNQVKTTRTKNKFEYRNAQEEDGIGKEHITNSEFQDINKFLTEMGFVYMYGNTFDEIIAENNYKFIWDRHTPCRAEQQKMHKSGDWEFPITSERILINKDGTGIYQSYVEEDENVPVNAKTIPFNDIYQLKIPPKTANNKFEYRKAEDHTSARDPECESCGTIGKTKSVITNVDGKNKRVNVCTECAKKYKNKTSSNKFVRVASSQAYLFPNGNTWWVEYFESFKASPKIGDTEMPSDWDGNTAMEMFQNAHPDISVIDYFNTFDDWKKEAEHDQQFS